VYGLNTSRSAWAYLAGRYADQSRSRISHLKRQLQSLQQGSKNLHGVSESSQVMG
jgi:hypothetical protein